MPYLGTSPSSGLAGADLNGQSLILDADADTHITADTDDTIDISIAGADDFKLTANKLSVLSGSDLNINSGGTVTNAGTAYGFESLPAYTGVLQTNANFVDQVIFGPSVDGVPWNGAWSKASVYSSLMLATIEDEGSNTEINIWDLTEQTSGAISTTPLATVDLANAATPTAIAACMGYLIVSSEDGIAIIDPHSGAWAERTQGWPRTLSTSTSPALADNSVTAVAMGFAYQSAYDPRTGGYIPQLAGCYGAGGSCYFVIDEYGTLENRGTNVDPNGITITDGYLFAADTANRVLISGPLNYAAPIASSSVVWADNSSPYAFVPDNAMDGYNGTVSVASADGLSIIRPTEYNTNFVIVTSAITRAYNTGFMVGDIRGAWLANSNTVDRSYKANTLTNNGTVPTGATASGAELNFYGPFSSSNYLNRASDADWDVVGTGTLCLSFWINSASGGTPNFFSIAKSGNAVVYNLHLISGVPRLQVIGATASTTLSGTTDIADEAWHKVDAVHVSSTERYIYVDGVLENSNTTDTGSISDSGNLPLAIGVNADGSTDPFTQGKLSLVRLSATAPTAVQVREMYDAEKGMFVASAECLLQSGSTDAVLDVDVDKLTGKVLVTQTDAITVFDGLVVDSKPTVNSGASEKGKLWGDLRAEQNAANAYVTAPATDQRQVNEMVRGLASDLPKGIDLSKAKAWAQYDSASVAIRSSYNVKSITDRGTGAHTINFSVPFKSGKYACLGACRYASGDEGVTFANTANTGGSAYVYVTRGSNGAYADPGDVYVVFFGELENE